MTHPLTPPDDLRPLLEQLGPDWRYAGSVAVDTGAVLVADAAAAPPDPLALDQAQARSSYGPLAEAVHCSAGLGDGLYPVVVRVVDLPDWGERVAELRVLFLDPGKVD